MKIHANRRDLAANLSWCLQTVPSKHPQPICLGVRISSHGDHLMLRTTDWDTFHTARVDAITDGDDQTVVSAKRLHDIVAASSSQDVDLVLDAGLVTVKAGRSAYTFHTMPVDDFPQPVAELPGGATIQADTLRHLLATTSAAVMRGADGHPAVLYGVHLVGDGNELTASTTDRFNASIATVTYAGDQLEVCVPHRGLVTAAKAFTGDVTLAHNEGLLQLTDGSRTATLRLLEDQFPRMAGLFPKSDTATLSITTNTVEAAAALNRLALIVERNKPVVLSATSAGVTIRTTDGDDVGSGDEILDATTTGTGDIAVNPIYLAALLDACPDGATDLHLFGAHKPMLIDPPGRQQHLLMPVRQNA